MGYVSLPEGTIITISGGPSSIFVDLCSKPRKGLTKTFQSRGKGLTGTLPGPGAFTPSWSTTSNYGFLGVQNRVELVP